jgi:octaprenyl-diphosphate synthase
LADVTLRMTEGEMLQTRYVGRIDLTEEEYLDLVERKTAALFACCCELAGILAGVDDDRRAALKRYGLKLGLAFQLVDDLLDYTGDAATLGKPAAIDLREGKVTLALIGQLEEGSGEVRDLAEKIMAEGRPDMPEIARLSALLRKQGAIAKTYDRARMYAEGASKELESFEDSPSRRALQSLPDLLLFRVR